MQDEQGNRVFLLSSNAEHRHHVAAVLDDFFQVTLFPDEDGVLDEVETARPRAILVDEGLRPRGGFHLIETVRRNRDTRFLPILLIGRMGGRMATHQAVSRGASAYVSRTVGGIGIAEAASKMINRSIEEIWDNLDQSPRVALKTTLKSYQDLADRVRAGAPVEIAEVEASCRNVIDCVATGGVRDMLDAVREHDDYTYVHSLRVCAYLTVFGFGVGLRGQDLTTLAIGGLLHDIGKIKIPVPVLNKKGGLSPDEWELLQKHVPFGLEVLGQTREITRGIKIICGQHHEKLDGSGYPDGIAGKQINLLARMAGIVDIFVALTDRRIYRPAASTSEAFAAMATMEAQIDPHLTQVFREMVLDLG